MRLYLVRHAEAKSDLEDPARPLSVRGEQEIGAVAGHLAKLGIRVERIFHSSKLRARQTAAVIGGAFEGSYRARPLVVEESDGLAPSDDPSIWAGRLAEMAEDIMLVGHLPHLARLAALLLCGDPEEELISFPPAGVVCLEGGGGGRWSIVWMITPGTLVSCLMVEGSPVIEGDAGI